MSESRDRKPRKPGAGRGASGGRRNSGGTSGGSGSAGRGSRSRGGKRASSSGSGSSGRSRSGDRKSSQTGGSRRSGGDDRKSYDGDRSNRRGRDSDDQQRSGSKFDDAPQKKLPAAAEGLPRHVVESLLRVTPAARQNAALAGLAAAAEAFSEGQFHVAVKKALNAKDLSSRDATIREILALASYRIGDWNTALRELRTYRRLSGETTHMPVEIDVLRAMGRDEDVAAVWQDFQKRGGSPAVKKEARVVYASFLIDRGELDEARDVAGKPKVAPDPWPEDMRLWYVAARIAALSGDKARARHLADAILLEDPSFPGLDDLDRLINAG